MNTRHFLGVLALDIILTVALLFAPSWVVMYLILPLVVLGLLGAFLSVVTSTPIKESWAKPSWFGFYGWITDIAFLAAAWYMGYSVIFWLYLFMLPFKLLVKREPYHGE